MAARNSYYLILALIAVLEGLTPKSIAKCFCYLGMWYGAIKLRDWLCAIAISICVNAASVETNSYIACRECLPKQNFSQTLKPHSLQKKTDS